VHGRGLGDLSHASAVFSRDGRYAFVFGRDGGLTKVDLLEGEVDKRIVLAGNSIGGAISSSGRLVAVSNYEPGGVKVFDSETLEQVADLPAVGGDGMRSKVAGLVDAPGESGSSTPSMTPARSGSLTSRSRMRRLSERSRTSACSRPTE
jgi:protein NirF